MNLQQLETFRWVVTLASFTKAAVKLNTSQSTVSMRIAELERELGMQILDRAQRFVRTTPKGRDLLRYAVEIDRLVTELKVNVGNPETVSGSVRMGVAELIALTWLPDLVSMMNRLYPRIEIDLEVGLTGTLYDKIRAGETDLSLVPVAERPGGGIRASLLGRVEFAFMVAPSIGLPKERPGPPDLEGVPLISLGPNSTLSAIEERWFGKNRSRPTKINRSNSMEISAGLVRSGLGMSLLPVDYYAPDISAGRMVALDVRPALRPVPFYAVYLDDSGSPLIRRVVEIAKRVSACGDYRQTSLATRRKFSPRTPRTAGSE